MRYNTFILFGAPGSGKGTQGKTLGTIPRFYHCACGDVFRSIDTRTKVGKAFLEYSSKGELVPDEITVELWREAIEAAVDAHKFKPDIDTLVRDGWRMRVYVPFGTQWYPYLMRRLAERPANVAFMTGNIVREALSRRRPGPARRGPPNAALRSSLPSRARARQATACRTRRPSRQRSIRRS